MTASFNIGSLDAGLQAAAQKQVDAAQAGLSDWGEYVLQQAQRIVPIEEGTLSNSGMVQANGNEVAIGFGSGAAAAYAVAQHENGSYHHDAGRSYKYLEIPAIASGEKGLKLIQRRMAAGG